MLGDTPYQALFAKSGLDPIGKKVRIGAGEYTVVGVLDKRPSVGDSAPPRTTSSSFRRPRTRRCSARRRRRAFRGQTSAAP